eukprot:scaffold9030_cov123-Chaetoceros_neogracile.AAC.1
MPGHPDPITDTDPQPNSSVESENPFSPVPGQNDIKERDKLSNRFITMINGEVKIDVTCTGKPASQLTFSTDLLMDHITNGLATDLEAVSAIYDEIMDCISSANWFDGQITRQIRAHFDDILHASVDATKGQRPHIRGLTYVMNGRDVILISDYAKSIKRKSVNNNFVLQFNLDRAFSTNEKLLATVTQGTSLANPRPYVSGLSRASYGMKDKSSIGYDQGSSSSASRYIDLVDLPAMEEYDETYGAEKPDLLPTTVHYESSPDEYVRQGRRSNHSHKRYNATDDFHASKPP